MDVVTALEGLKNAAPDAEWTVDEIAECMSTLGHPASRMEVLRSLEEACATGVVKKRTGKRIETPSVYWIGE